MHNKQRCTVAFIIRCVLLSAKAITASMLPHVVQNVINLLMISIIVQCIGIAFLMMSIVVHCIEIALILISIVLQCIGIALLKIIIVVQCIRNRKNALE